MAAATLHSLLVTRWLIDLHIGQGDVDLIIGTKTFSYLWTRTSMVLELPAGSVSIRK